MPKCNCGSRIEIYSKENFICSSFFAIIGKLKKKPKTFKDPYLLVYKEIANQNNLKNFSGKINKKSIKILPVVHYGKQSIGAKNISFIDPNILVRFIIKKKYGKANIRNRVKRRLKEAIRLRTIKLGELFFKDPISYSISNWASECRIASIIIPNNSAKETNLETLEKDIERFYAKISQYLSKVAEENIAKYSAEIQRNSQIEQKLIQNIKQNV